MGSTCLAHDRDNYLINALVKWSNERQGNLFCLCWRKGWPTFNFASGFIFSQIKWLVSQFHCNSKKRYHKLYFQLLITTIGQYQMVAEVQAATQKWYVKVEESVVYFIIDVSVFSLYKKKKRRELQYINKCVQFDMKLFKNKTIITGIKRTIVIYFHWLLQMLVVLNIHLFSKWCCVSSWYLDCNFFQVNFCSQICVCKFVTMM